MKINGKTNENIIAGVNVGSTYDAKIYRIPVNATSISANQVIYTLQGTGNKYDDYVSSVKVTSDRGILFGGWYYSDEGLDVNKDGVLDDKFDFPSLEGSDKSDGYIIKLDETGKVEYSSRLYGDGYEGTTSVAETREGSLVAGGYFNGNKLTAKSFDTRTKAATEQSQEAKTVELFNGIGNSEGFVIYEGLIGPKINETQSLQVENKIKTFKITTEVRKNNSELGGTITGDTGNIGGIDYSIEGKRYVETVEYGENSIKQIVITPKTPTGKEEDGTYSDTAYVIDYIIINGEKVENYVINSDGTVTLPIFEDVKQDYHIIVQFSNTISNIEVNHYLWKGNIEASTQKVAESTTQTGEVGTEYSTLPNTEIDYDIITNQDFYGEGKVPEGKNPEDLYIPQNYKGTYTSGNKEIINYFYKERTYTLTIHHYIEGTNDKVPLKDSKDGQVVEDIITENLKKGSDYETQDAIAEGKVDTTIYELVQTPENAKGKIEGNTEVIYYYKIKPVGFTITKVAEENHTKTIQGTQFSLYKYIGDFVGEGNKHDKLIDKNNVDTTNWRLVGNYTSSSLGLVRFENLEITSKYRLIEIKASQGRLTPEGQWNIEFIYGDYDKNDTSIVTLDGTPLKVTAIGNPPAFAIEEGKILIPNKEIFQFPISGAFGIKGFTNTGLAILAIGMLILLLRKRLMLKRPTRKNSYSKNVKRRKNTNISNIHTSDRTRQRNNHKARTTNRRKHNKYKPKRMK